MSGRQQQQQSQQQSQSKDTNAARPSSRRTQSIQSTASTPSVDTANLNEANPRSASSTIQSPAQPYFRVPQSPRGTSGEGQAKAAKVAIPRLKRSVDVALDGATRSGGKHRVNHACEPCRHRKTKCSGDRPVCQHCQDFRIVCFYADGKRDRVKKQFGSMSEKVIDYEKLLKDLLSRVSEDDANLIKISLDKAAQAEVDETITEPSVGASLDIDVEKESSAGEESEASGGVGSTGALDRTEEDFTREGAKSTGFMGKNSEITWIQRLRQENQFGDSPSPSADENTQRIHNISSTSLQSKRQPEDNSVTLPEAADGFSIHESSYHLDDLDIATSDTVDPYEMPTRSTAQILFNTFMHRVHPTFPIIGLVNLSAQFQRFIHNPVQRPPDKWLAIINLMFAISARYGHLIEADWKGDERDHIIYFSRARLLAVDADILFVHPDLQLIQILGLMSIYLMCTSQINRSWTLVGTVIRMGISLGLNMRNDSANLKDSLKEIRYRLWWSLFVLEHRLCSITGRVNCILDEHYTTPLPVPIDEDKFDSEEAQRLLSRDSQQAERAPSANSHPTGGPSSAASRRSRSSGKSEQSHSPSTLQSPDAELNWAKDVQPCSSLYFLHLVQLTRLTQKVSHYLYNPESVDKSWSQIQAQIKSMNDQLDGWYRQLPAIFDFQRKQRDRDFFESRLNLGFAYYSTKQMIHRPCLCRLDRKLPNQSNHSREFNRSSAATCVESAQDMLRLIPDESNAVGLIRSGPWWTILPYLVQAASVLMLELSFRAHHMPEDADSILDSSKKAIRWLHALSKENLSARRAWALCDNLLRGAVAKIGRDVNDLPNMPLRNESFSSASSTRRANLSVISAMDASQFEASAIGLQPPMYENAGTVPTYPTLPEHEQLMQYDQYFPFGDTMNVAMTGQQHPHFMSSAYEDDHHPDSGGMPNERHNYMQ